LFLLKEGDLILQVTFAWEGAIAVCSEGEDGLYGSVRFPTYRVDPSRCTPEYLARYLCTEHGLAQIRGICPGSAGRNRVLSLKRLHEVMVPLPSLDEQRSIVDRLAGVETKIETAKLMRRDADKATMSLVAAVHASLSPPEMEPLSTFLELSEISVPIERGQPY